MVNRRFVFSGMLALLLGLSFSFAGTGSAQFLYDGPDRYISGQQQLAEYIAIVQQSAARDATGNYIAVWESLPSNANEYDVFARRFATDDTPLGPTFQVNQNTARAQLFAAVGMAADGRFVVAWDDRELVDPLGNGPSDVGARLFDADGNPVTNDLAVNTYTIGNQGMPTVSMAPDGRFVVMWTSGPREDTDPTQDGSDSGVFGQLYDATGTPAGTEFAANSYTTSFQQDPNVVMRADGSFVAAWNGYGPGGNNALFARIFDASATAAGPEFRVDEGGALSPRGPRLAADPDGSFVVAWEAFDTLNNGLDGDQSAAIARRFDASGTPLTSQLVMNTYTVGRQSAATVASHGDGTFSVLWQDGDEFPGERAIIGRFDSDGSPLGAQIAVNYNADDRPSLLAFPDGRAVVLSQARIPRAGALIAAQTLCDPASGCTADDGCSASAGGIDVAIALRNVGVDPSAGNDQLMIKGEFDLPNGTVFEDFIDDFGYRGESLRIIVASSTGTVRSDDAFSVGTGDVRFRRDGSLVLMKDRDASVNGFRSFAFRRLTRFDNPGPDRVQFRAKAKGATIPVIVGDEPIRVTLDLAGHATCGPQTFAPATCAFDAGQTTLTCP